MEARLKIVAGKHSGKEIPIKTAQFMIGRSEDCHLRSRSDKVSRHHSAITLRESYLAVRDLGSRNGTLVNGKAIEKETELRDGDLLQIGPLEFEIVVRHNLAGEKRPAMRDLSELAERTARAPAQKARDGEIDDWIGQPEPLKGGKWEPSGDTKAISASSDDTVDMAFQGTAVGGAGKSQPKPQDKDQDKEHKGKLPRLDNEKTKDSREAAANVLKRLARHRSF